MAATRVLPTTSHQSSQQNHSNKQQACYQDKIFVGLENVDADFDLIGRIVGPNNTFFSHIQLTGAQCWLRGQGSGFLENESGREGLDALHIHIQHPSPSGLSQAKLLAENLIQTVRQQYFQWRELRKSMANKGSWPPSQAAPVSAPQPPPAVVVNGAIATMPHPPPPPAAPAPMPQIINDMTMFQPPPPPVSLPQIGNDMTGLPPPPPGAPSGPAGAPPVPPPVPPLPMVNDLGVLQAPPPPPPQVSTGLFNTIPPAAVPAHLMAPPPPPCPIVLPFDPSAPPNNQPTATKLIITDHNSVTGEPTQQQVIIYKQEQTSTSDMSRHFTSSPSLSSSSPPLLQETITTTTTTYYFPNSAVFPPNNCQPPGGAAPPPSANPAAVFPPPPNNCRPPPQPPAIDAGVFPPAPPPVSSAVFPTNNCPPPPPPPIPLPPLPQNNCPPPIPPPSFTIPPPPAMLPPPAPGPVPVPAPGTVPLPPLPVPPPTTNNNVEHNSSFLGQPPPVASSMACWNPAKTIPISITPPPVFYNPPSSCLPAVGPPGAASTFVAWSANFPHHQQVSDSSCGSRGGKTSHNKRDGSGSSSAHRPISPNVPSSAASVSIAPISTKSSTCNSANIPAQTLKLSISSSSPCLKSSSVSTDVSSKRRKGEHEKGSVSYSNTPEPVFHHKKASSRIVVVKKTQALSSLAMAYNNDTDE